MLSSPTAYRAARATCRAAAPAPSSRGAARAAALTSRLIHTPALSTTRRTSPSSLSAHGASKALSEPAARAIHLSQQTLPKHSESVLKQPLTAAFTTSAKARASARSEAAGGAPVSSAELVQVSTLSNGVRVATEATPGHFSAAGVYIDTGSRFERPWVKGESGISHLLDRMAFKVSAA